MNPRDRHLFSPGPKRVLALDGGGVRGIISLAFLESVEAIVRSRMGPDVLLADYFDLIGGTSTGSIIATGLALGLRVQELIEIYLNLASDGFKGSRWHGGLLVPKFRTAPLMTVIRRYVKDEALGSDKLRTGLAIVAKRIDTGSVWVFHNNPRGPFFDPVDGTKGGLANKDFPLAKLIRASTAAPTFFRPERIDVAPGVSGLFVDGGVSPHANPALLLLMLATIKGYGFQWPTGSDRLLVMSVGTGYQQITPAMMPSEHAPAINLARLALYSVMADASWLGQAILQWLGSSPTLWHIDSEIGDLAGDQIGERAAFHYLRYELALTSEWLQRELGMTVSALELTKLAEFDRPEMVTRLLEIGRAAAKRQVWPDHLPAVFDVSAADR